MRRSVLLSRPPTVLQPAWWCRITIEPRHPARARDSALTHLTHEPAATLVSLRTQLRVLLHLMNPEDTRTAFRWLDQDQPWALLSLRAGDPVYFTGRSDTIDVRLTAHPVLPLPRATPAAPCGYGAATPETAWIPDTRHLRTMASPTAN